MPLPVIREHTRCARALASSPSELRASGPTPKWPFLARIRYFYGHDEHAMSDIIGHGYEKHVTQRRKAVKAVTTTLHQV